MENSQRDDDQYETNCRCGKEPEVHWLFDAQILEPAIELFEFHNLPQRAASQFKNMASGMANVEPMTTTASQKAIGWSIDTSHTQRSSLLTSRFGVFELHTFPPLDANIGIDYESKSLQWASRPDIVAVAIGSIAIGYFASLIAGIDLDLPARFTLVGNPGYLAEFRVFWLRFQNVCHGPSRFSGSMPLARRMSRTESSHCWRGRPDSSSMNKLFTGLPMNDSASRNLSSAAYCIFIVPFLSRPTRLAGHTSG